MVALPFTSVQLFVRSMVTDWPPPTLMFSPVHTGAVGGAVTVTVSNGAGVAGVNDVAAGRIVVPGLQSKLARIVPGPPLPIVALMKTLPAGVTVPPVGPTPGIGGSVPGAA